MGGAKPNRKERRALPHGPGNEGHAPEIDRTAVKGIGPNEPFKNERRTTNPWKSADGETNRETAKEEEVGKSKQGKMRNPFGRKERKTQGERGNGSRPSKGEGAHRGTLPGELAGGGNGRLRCCQRTDGTRV